MIGKNFYRYSIDLRTDFRYVYCIHKANNKTNLLIILHYLISVKVYPTLIYEYKY